jgi:hypothetical protein
VLSLPTADVYEGPGMLSYKRQGDLSRDDAGVEELVQGMHNKWKIIASVGISDRNATMNFIRDS